jgi:ABC-type Fe3+-siderophore transport system permease subunit
LACCESCLDISPIIFFAITTLCCSILAGAGMQGLVSAGSADREWLLLTSLVMGALAIVALLLATKYFQSFLGIADPYALLLTQAAKMYILGAIALAILFFMARARLRLHPIRLVLLCAPIAIDFFLCATDIVDKTL